MQPSPCRWSDKSEINIGAWFRIKEGVVIFAGKFIDPFWQQQNAEKIIFRWEKKPHFWAIFSPSLFPPKILRKLAKWNLNFHRWREFVLTWRCASKLSLNVVIICPKCVADCDARLNLNASLHVLCRKTLPWRKFTCTVTPKFTLTVTQTFT